MTYKENSNVFLANSGTSCPTKAIGGHLWGTYNPYKQLYNPYIAGNHQTLGNVTSLTPFLLETGTISGWSMPRAQLTTNYAFISNYDTELLTRYAIADLSSSVYDPSPGYMYHFEVYSEDIVYTLEEIDIGDDWYYQLCKITFTNGISSKELLLEWLENGYAYDGHNWWMNELIGLEHVKYNSNDAIVYLASYLSEDHPYQTIIKSIIYNINTGVATSVDTRSSTDDDACMNTTYYDCSPSFYKNYLIYSYTIEPNTTSGLHAFIGTAIVDISNNTVTIVDDIKIDLDTYLDAYDYFYFASGMINYTNGIYYFEYVSNFPDRYTQNFRLGKINLESTPPVSEYVKNLATDNWAMALTVLQSDTVPYGIPLEYEGTQNIYLIPDTSIANIVDINDLLYDNFCVCTVDIPNEIVWNLTNTNLQGRDLISSNNRNITVNWTGRVVPFAYTGKREVYLQILDNVALVGVSCYSYPDYQFDWYLLK